VSSDSEITSRLAERTADDALAIFNLLVLMHDEVGRHPLNHQKAFREICLCIEHGAAYMVYRGEELVASSGFRQAVPWYSDETLFSDQWFYVRKDCRGDSRALRALSRKHKVSPTTPASSCSSNSTTPTGRRAASQRQSRKTSVSSQSARCMSQRL
jgi:hypothetical protein